MTKVEFRALGPFEVSLEGRTLELKRRKQRALLALLMLHAGEVVSTDRLIEELWSGSPPKAAVGSLQNLISELRKVLGAELVRTHHPGYVLDIRPEQVDLKRFERLVAQASEGGDPHRRAELLREGLALWRGPAFADLAFETFVQVEIARLDELRTAAREELVDAELDLGRHSQLVAELETLVADNPLRERLRAQLMLALYRSGRQAEALEAYRDARRMLMEELGIDPSPELQQLEQAILRHDQDLDLPARVVAPPAGPDRRKTVTVLFTALSDSVSLGAALDPEVMRTVMSRYFDSLRTIVEGHRGTMEKLVGDTAVAIFGIPQQHEDDALRAVRAATEFRQAIAALNEDLQQDHGVAIHIRTAINTGEVVVGTTSSGEPSATGSAMNVAVELHSAALPGEIVLGPLTHSLVRDAADTEPVEPVEIGGPVGRISAHRLVDLSGSAGERPQRSSAFVGREDELARLRTAFEQARAENRSRVFTVLGEAGVGKSRLVRELASSLGREARFVVGRCLSYGTGATYLPLAEIVRQVAPVRPRSAIAELLAGDSDAELISTRLTELTGEAGDGSTGEVFWATRRLLEALGRQQPLVVVLEDAHWAEPSLLDLVEYLETWISDAPVLVLCNARPTLLEGRAGWGRSATSETLELRPLPANQAEELVAALAGEQELSDALRGRIVAVAEGNALFLEQLHAYLTEDAPPGAIETVPPSIEALLASRLDALEAGDRALIERAAVVGRDFARSAVMHLTPPEELASLDSRLIVLERRGLVRSLRGRPTGEDAIRFHHVLIRDVAYSAITKDRRADLHERHGAWLEKRREADELVGYHAEQAHRLRSELRPADPDLERLATWAGEHLAAAGLRAWRRADTPATVNLLGRAAGLLPSDNAERVELLCELGVARRVLGDFEGAEKTLAEACALGARDQRVLLRAQLELAFLRLLTETHASSDFVEIAAKAIPIFEELEDDRALGRTWRQVGYVRSFEGRLGDWQEAVERAVVHYRRSGWSASGCLGELAAALFYGPTPVPEALEHCEELLDDASDRVGDANVLAFMSGLEAIDGRFAEARTHLAEAESTYEELGETYARANYCLRVRGRVEMLAGDPACAEAVLRESCAVLERVHDEAGLSTIAAKLADALYAQGRYDEAAGWLDLAEKRGSAEDVSAQYTWRRVRAKLLARAGAHRDAERLAHEAAQLAANTDALSDHGNVLLDLAEVLLLAGKESPAAREIERGLELFERKGNRVSAQAAQAMLSELTLA